MAVEQARRILIAQVVTQYAVQQRHTGRSALDFFARKFARRHGMDESQFVQDFLQGLQEWRETPPDELQELVPSLVELHAPDEESGMSDLVTDVMMWSDHNVLARIMVV